MPQSFTFHNVGQGLFYSGRIDNFNFVYDCGSSEKDRKFLTNSVAKYKQSVTKVNLLILSHLHYDHTAGLDFLLNGVKVNKVVLPYFLPLERLVLSLKSLRHPQWFYNFLSDPIRYLLEKGVAQVVLIGGTGGRYPDITPEYYPSEDEEPDLNQLRDDPELMDTVKENDPQLKFCIGKELLVKNHDGYVRALGKWFFRFFNYKVPSPQLSVFKQCVDTQLGAGYNLVEVIKSSSLSKIKSCYKKVQVSSDYNDTSLLAYHAPIKPSDGQRTIRLVCSPPYCNFLRLIPPSVCPYSFTVEPRSRLGHFLTGDINFNTNIIEIEKHFQSYFPNASVVQIPHHGANRNWNVKILNNFSNGTIFVASAGTNNKFNHPDSVVICDIEKNHNFLWCNELAGIEVYYA